MPSGTDALHRLIEESSLSYPVSVTRLEREHSLESVPLDDSGNSIMVVELLTEVDADTFRDEDDLRETMEPVVEEKIRERNPGFAGRLVRIFKGHL